MATAALSRNCQTVLLVDDEDFIVRLLETVLRRNRLAVVTATTGAEALRLFGKHAAELCLLVVDVALTDMSGFQFLAQLPTLTPRIPVLCITGLGEGEVKPGLPRDCSVLWKPFTAEQFMSAVRTALSAGRSGA